jgi:hypothetical protein
MTISIEPFAEVLLPVHKEQAVGAGFGVLRAA